MSIPQFFMGRQLGAPALGTLGTGDLKRVLDCIVDGFATQSCTIAVSGGIATATVTGHDWLKHQWVTISGVAGGPTGFALLNGCKRIITPASNTLTFDATGVSNGSATGTILAKLSGIGEPSGNLWAKQFTGTNSTSLRAAVGVRHSFMVNDNANTNTCIVRAFHTMSTSILGVSPYPTNAQSSTNLKWPRPDPTTLPYPPLSGTYDDSWFLIGDDKRFFLSVALATTGNRFWMGFGDFQSYKSADAYNAFIFGMANGAGDDTLNPGTGIALSNPQASSQGAGQYYGSQLALARHQNQSTVSWLAGMLPPFGAGSTPSESTLSGSPSSGTSSPISGGIDLTGCVDILENITGGSFYYRRGRLPLLTSWNKPDFENNDKTVYTVAGFGDIMLVRGFGYGVTDGIIFPMGDWDNLTL